MRQRWYDPTLQRFISQDPIGLSGGSNLYSYVKNNPTARIDPRGTWDNTVKCHKLEEELKGLRDSILRQIKNITDNKKKLKFRNQECGKPYSYAADIEGHLLKLSMDFWIYQQKYTRYIIECNNFGPPKGPLPEPFPVPVPKPNWDDETAREHIWVPEPLPLPEWEPLSNEQKVRLTAALTAAATAAYWITSEGSRFLFPPRNLVPIP